MRVDDYLCCHCFLIIFQNHSSVINLSKALIVLFSLFAPVAVSAQVLQATKVNYTTIEIQWKNNFSTTFDFYGDNIVRIFQDTTGKKPIPPQAIPKAEILVSQPRKKVTNLTLLKGKSTTAIRTSGMEILVNNLDGTFSITDLRHKKKVVELVKPVEIGKDRTILTLKENPDEYFFGGGVQNGRFSHKGKKIAIENQNSWTDGGVASPAPFYWSTGGYAFMWYTFKRGTYDFGTKEKDEVSLFHETNYLDVFFMIDSGAVALLNDYYQLTGHPVLIPKFGFYEGHLNAYNRDYWKEDTAHTGILFEDGKYYKESQKNNGGVRESLNGELNNYQFSARAVIDRYQRHDMPLGWILPNDGYGAGYGQSGTLDSNILNLKIFGEYAHKHGVQIGLWTQSDLHPKKGVSALLQRDLVKEVGVAGVRVLKTDVAWVGDGYSFGLNGIADAAGIMTKYGNDARPFIITLDGWAGTQRYGTIWTGDQTGGQWEYIRFHIPTYLGAGLSGLPNITSDMDGIFGGKNLLVNIRDFQWKTFTPMQLNMDGWGSNPKYPFALGEPATSINRMYLKWKSELLPYSYSIAAEAVDGLPIIRPMFLSNRNAYTLGTSTEYQFLYGPYFLIAPIYQNTRSDSSGNDIRNNIYLPDGKWIDYFTGEEYEGNRIINNFYSPIWKLPVFVKKGAIIPLANPNNHPSEIDKHHRIYEIYPSGKTSFTEYNDDGATEEYRSGKFATTLIESNVSGNKVNITIYPTRGNFTGFEKIQSTEFRIDATAKPKSIAAFINARKLSLQPVNSLEELQKKSDCYYFDSAPELNQFATPGSGFSKISIRKNPILFINISQADITQSRIRIEIDGYIFRPLNTLLKMTGVLKSPADFTASKDNSTAYTLMPRWRKVSNADFYEIEFQQMMYSTIRDTSLLFENLKPETEYQFKLRAVNLSGNSGWTILKGKTGRDPLEFAIHGIRGWATAPSQGREPLKNLFDFDEGNQWHTKWDTTATPFDLIIDLRSINQIDKFQYLPRSSGGNGIWQKGTVYFSMDKNEWTNAGDFDWKADHITKEFKFINPPKARYLKISIADAVGKFGSGRELYVFKVPGSESYIPGDINHDGFVDHNDLTSYMNYTGLRKGDADFEGYISKGDINENGLIDAYDISNVAVELDGGARSWRTMPVKGSVALEATKQQFQKGDTINILVKGKGLKNVNALSFALPYPAQEYEYLGIKSLNTQQMQNLTYDRLHSNGEKVLYPTFVNIGDKKTIEGSEDLFIIQFIARKSIQFNLKPTDGILVDKGLGYIKF